MPTSIVDAESLLAFDLGTVTTRALLFDVVDGRYRFVAGGSAPTTAYAPLNDIGEGVRQALDQLQLVTGRKFVDENEKLILPSRPDGSGIDACVATLSVGEPLRVVAVGLLEDVSAESAQRLASTVYAKVVEKLSLNDRRKPSARLDAILRERPDVIIVAGGTEGGASHSVINLLEAVGLACYLEPREQRPEVLFAGNQSLIPEVENTIGTLAHLVMAPNVRPSLEAEQLMPAQTQLASVFRAARVKSLPGVAEIDAWTGGKLLPVATAFGRMVRFLSRVYDPGKGVIGIEVGASATTVAAAFAGDLVQGVYPELGLGRDLPGMLQYTAADDILRWMMIDLSETDLRDYMQNKSLRPYLLPVTADELAIEEALARRAIQLAVRRLRSGFPERVAGSGEGLTPWFEPVMVGGSVLSQAPSRARSLLTVLDGLQPTGVTTVMIDPHGLLPALGAAAGANSILPIQVLESTTFINLGAVISPVGNIALGAPVLRAQVKFDAGGEANLEVKQGGFEVIALPQGQKATLMLQPLNRFDVGMGGPGKGGKVRVTGGALGVIIDARGRPLRLPADLARRKELYNHWLSTLGG